MELALFLVLLFSVFSFAAVELWSVAIAQISFFAIFARALKKSGRCDFVSYKTILPAVILVAVVGLAQYFNEIPVNWPKTFLPFTVWKAHTAQAIILWMSYAALLWSAPQIIKTPAQFRRALWVIFSAGVGMSLLGILQKTNPSAIYGLREIAQGATAFGPFVNKNNAADFLLMSFMAGAGIFLSRFSQIYKYHSRARIFDFFSAQLLVFVMLGITAYAILKTGSRGALHGLMFSACVTAFLLSFSKRIRSRLPAIFMGALLLGYGLFLFQNKIMLGIKPNAAIDNSVQVRLSLYKSGLYMLGDFPMFGSGLGAFSDGFALYQEKSVDGIVEHAHSDWLELALEVGLVGIALYLAGFILMIRYSLKKWRNCPSAEVFFLAGGILSGILACLFHNIADFGLQIPAIAFTFYFLLGLLSCGPVEYGKSEDYSNYTADTEIKPSFAKKYIFPALAYLLMVACLPPVLGWYYNLRAKNAPPEQKPALYAKALSWQEEPRYAVRLGASYYNLAVKNPQKSREFLQEGYKSIEPYIPRLPADKNFLRLKENILFYIRD
ncbi:MAG: O-antigen ligase family protein [Elusimicrobia bacterium]|nr:O-antigen ligase family protein [Elusimicrobiota bacterium]